MNINNPLDSLPDMAVFARVVDAGSFSGAARQLGTTPSAVSRQVARLEAVLRVRLLERTTRKLRLTDAGAAAYTRCQAIPGPTQGRILALQCAQARHQARHAKGIDANPAQAGARRSGSAPDLPDQSSDRGIHAHAAGQHTGSRAIWTRCGRLRPPTTRPRKKTPRPRQAYTGSPAAGAPYGQNLESAHNSGRESRRLRLQRQPQSIRQIANRAIEPCQQKQFENCFI